MNELVLRNVKVVDPAGPYHDLTVDILVRDGVIVKVGVRITAKGALDVTESLRSARHDRNPNEGGLSSEAREELNIHVSPGWVDLRAHFRDPGEE